MRRERGREKEEGRREVVRMRMGRERGSEEGVERNERER